MGNSPKELVLIFLKKFSARHRFPHGLVTKAEPVPSAFMVAKQFLLRANTPGPQVQQKKFEWFFKKPPSCSV